MWPFSNPDDAFRGAIRSHAVLTIGAYPGHFRSVCVKVRSCEKEEAVTVKDGADIGLANIERFVTGRVSGIYDERKDWSAASLRKEVEALASKVREVGMPFLASATADWDGVRDMIAARISRMFEEQPWLKRYEKNA